MLPVNLLRITQDFSNKKEHIELNPIIIYDKINQLLEDYELKLLPCLKKNSKYFSNDDRSLKYLFEIALHNYLCPKKCIFEYGLTSNDFDKLIDDIKLSFIKALVVPGEMVGIIAAQSIGEPTSQMSITHSSKILLIIKNKKNNNIKIYSNEIGKLCNKLINKYSELTYPVEGHENSVETDISSLNKEYYIIGVDKQEKTHWNKISHISRHPVNGQLMKVKTRSGRSVETTLSHSHLIRRNQSVEPILGSELKIGMRIPVCKHIDNIFINDTIELDGKYHKLDHLFGWFIGAYLAEGSINGNNIKITNISEHFINNTTKIAEIFNKNVNIRKYQGEYGLGVDTSFNYKELAILLIENCGNSSYNKFVPTFAYTAPNEFKAGLIQGYFDGDGNFQNDESRNLIRVCSRSDQLINDIALLLSYFDIFSSIKCNMVKGIEIYNLSISSKYGPLYKQHIGSELHTNKLNHICEYAMRENAHNLSDEIDKINGLGDLIAKCGKELKLQGQSRTYGRWAKKESIGRRTLEKYIKIFEEHNDVNKIQTELTILKQACNSNVIWDEIVDIQIYTPTQTDYVYDFTVPNNQTFMIDNGIIVHNTLNTKHSAGQSKKNKTTSGLPRIEELLHYSRDIKTPQMIIYFDESISHEKPKVNKISSYFKYLSIKELIDNAQIYYDLGSDILKNDNVANPLFINNQKSDSSAMPLVFRLKFNMEKLYDKETSLLDIKIKFISYWNKNFTNLKNLNKTEKNIFTKISRCGIYSNNDKNNQIIHIRFNMTSFNYTMLTEFLKIVLEQITLKGIDNITELDLSNELRLTFDKETGDKIENKEWVVYTTGINYEKLKYIKGIDMKRTTCNDIATIYRLYGIESARQVLLNEFMGTFRSAGSDINHNHMSVLIDMMTHLGHIISIDRHGLSKIDSDPFTKASFEKTMDHFVNASIFNEHDSANSVSSRVLLGRVIAGGTGAFDLLLDTNKLENSEYTQDETGGRITFTPLEEEPLFKDILKYGFNKTDFFIPK
jgi:DNA-directed RNA polymerase beta' subunit